MAQTASLRAATISSDVQFCDFSALPTLECHPLILGTFCCVSSVHLTDGPNKELYAPKPNVLPCHFFRLSFTIQRLLKCSPRTQDKDHYVVVLSRLWRISDSVASECWSFSSLLEGPLNTRTICMHRRNLRLPTELWLLGSLLLSFWRLKWRQRWWWPFVVLDLGRFFCRLCTASIKPSSSFVGFGQSFSL